MSPDPASDGYRRFFLPCPHCRAWQSLEFVVFEGGSTNPARQPCAACGEPIPTSIERPRPAAVWIPAPEPHEDGPRSWTELGRRHSP